MGKLSGELRKPNRKDKVTRFPSVTYARQLGLLVITLGSHLKGPFQSSTPKANNDRRLGTSQVQRKGKQAILQLCAQCPGL